MKKVTDTIMIKKLRKQLALGDVLRQRVLDLEALRKRVAEAERRAVPQAPVRHSRADTINCTA
jgi:hypothetical protein